MEDLIRLEGITKKFGDHVIIPKLDLTIKDGEFLTLLGPSGCGKTTLLRMIAGLETPTTGRVLLDGKDITKLPPYKRDVNMVFQNYALFPHMTVSENIRFGLKMKGVADEEADERIRQVLYLIQLEELRDRYPSQMSGGQQQRVAIARALVNNPKVLLLDEPLGALDYQLRKKLQIELKNLQRGLGLTFIFVTHDQEEALTMSDRIVIMNNGVIQQDGDPNGIYHHPVNTFVARFIGESNFFDLDGKTYALRPEKLNLCEEEEESTAHPAPQFYGTVVDIVFYGTIDKVFIRLDNTNQTVVAYQYFDDLRRWKVDDRVGIWWYDRDQVEMDQ
ncbi:MAG: ABC transporter ATP-binding protein [Succiniclasticum sp.]|jgi:spermidine/putrescine transport system ATP-binding protein